MKKTLLSFAIFGLLFSPKMFAAVDPANVATQFICNGENIKIPNAAAGTTYEISYSTNPTPTPNDPIIPTVGPSETTFAPKGTGYYYIAVKNSTTNCISDWQEIPVYVLDPLTISPTVADYCGPNASTTTFTSTVSAKDQNAQDANIAYQWYSVDNTSSAETKITGATNATLVPVATTAGVYKYKLKYAYYFNNKYYCAGDSGVLNVTVSDLPTKPTITIESPVSGI